MNKSSIKGLVIPKNQRQALEALREGRSPEVVKNLFHLFRLNTAAGCGFLEAYMLALLVYVDEHRKMGAREVSPPSEILEAHIGEIRAVLENPAKVQARE